MKRILPRYGIDVVEVKRKQVANGEDVISASKVRELLQKRQFEKLVEFVPDTTLQYLMGMEF